MSDDLMPEYLDLELAVDYGKARDAFHLVLRRAVVVSKGAANRQVDGRRAWASILFTRLVVTGHSVLTLAPRQSAGRGVAEHWDHSSLASLTRNLLECYLLFFWLTVEDVPEDEWILRLNLTQLRDNETRKKMMADFGHTGEQLDGFAWHRGYLTERIRSKVPFQAMDEKRQKELLKADRAPYVQDDLVARLGLDRADFRGYYRLISSHTHTDPVSFFRMAEQGRGSGVENPIDRLYMGLAFQHAAYYLDRATAEMVELFPDLAEVASAVTAGPVGNRSQRRAAAKGRN